jgi:hypothetical protein
VHEARLAQTQAIDDSAADADAPPAAAGASAASTIPYPFSSGESLLALTRKHNVRAAAPCRRAR